MTRQQMLLTILNEECNETAQRGSKAIRFGLDEVQDGQELNNAERLIYEFNDIVAVMQILYEEKAIKQILNQDMIDEKKAKIEKWLKYSQLQNTLSE